MASLVSLSTIQRGVIFLALVCGCFQILLVRRHHLLEQNRTNQQHALLDAYRKKRPSSNGDTSTIHSFNHEADRRHVERRKSDNHIIASDIRAKDSLLRAPHDSFDPTKTSLSNTTATSTTRTVKGDNESSLHATTEDRKDKDNVVDDDDEIKYYHCTHEDGRNITLQQVPAFIIIGVQKAGTSALYDLLNLHPSIQGSIKPEAHFFDRRLPIDYLRNPTNQTWAEQYRCKVQEVYAKKFFDYDLLLQDNNPHIKFFDKTPAYITSKGAPFRIQAIAPWAKIIVSLRNPVARAFSQFRMETQPHQAAHLTFEERLGVSLDQLRKNRQYAANIPKTDPFPRPTREFMKINNMTDFEKIDAAFELWKQRNLIHRGFYLEQLQPWLLEENNNYFYTLGKNLLVVRYEQFLSDPMTVLHQIFDFVGVERPTNNTSIIYTPEILSAQYGPGRLRGKEGAIPEVAPPTPEALDFLAKLYKPYNDELADLLGEDWRGVWD